MPSARLIPLLFSTCALLLAACAGGTDGDDYADSLAQQHAADTPAPTTIVQEPIIPVSAQDVVYGTAADRPMTGYLARPEAADSVAQAMGLGQGTALPAVVLIHEWWGLNDNMRGMARRLAGEGYQVLAVDLYDGQVADDPSRAQDLVGQALKDPDRLTNNLTAAYAFLTGEQQAPRVAVMGYCFGGSMALNAALALPQELDAAVIYYGNVGRAERDALARLEMPLLGIFGGQDTSIPVEEVETFRQTLEELGKNAQVQVYEEAGHAFANPSGQNYVAAAAEDAWSRTTAFLRAHLYPAADDLAAR